MYSLNRIFKTEEKIFIRGIATIEILHNEAFKLFGNLKRTSLKCRSEIIRMQIMNNFFNYIRDIVLTITLNSFAEC